MKLNIQNMETCGKIMLSSMHSKLKKEKNITHSLSDDWFSCNCTECLAMYGPLMILVIALGHVLAT